MARCTRNSHSPSLKGKAALAVCLAAVVLALQPAPVHAQTDTTPPTFVSAEVQSSGYLVSVVYNENLDITASRKPSSSAFTILVDGVERPVVGISSTSSDPTQWLLIVNPSNNIFQGQTVTLSYTDPTTGNDVNAIQDVAGNDAASFINKTVTNNSTQAPPAPAAPTSLTATANGRTQIDLSWTTPASSVVTGYKIEVSSDGGTNWTDLETNTSNTNTTYNHTGLSASTTQHYRVSAINAAGAGDASNIDSATTDAITAPSAPRNLSTTVGDGEVTLTWETPSSDGGAPITRYEYQKDGSGSWTSTDMNLSETITNLNNGQQYSFEVRAVNSGGESAVATATATPAATVQGPVAPPGGTNSITDAPQYLRATTGNSEVTLTWSEPYRPIGSGITVTAITGYAYRYRQSDKVFDINTPGTWTNIPGEENARSHTVTGLTNGLGYTFEVRVRYAHGNGLSAKATVTLPMVVSIEDEELPTEVTLMGNYPNPFNPETTIGYVLPQASEARLVVYDLLGHEAAVLVDGLQSAGRHTVRFRASDLPSGSYVYRLEAGDKVVTRSMMLVK